MKMPFTEEAARAAWVAAHSSSQAPWDTKPHTVTIYEEARGNA